jgi:hypothetical protein
MTCAENAKVANANKASRQNMQQEAAKKLLYRQAHLALLVLMRGVTPSERDLPIGKRDKSVIGDGHAVRITAEVAQNVFGSAEWPFAVDDPLLPECLSNQFREHLGSAEWLQGAMEAQLSVSESILQSLNELTAKDFLQGSLRQ